MKLNLKIKQISPDRTTYKKYGVMYEPQNILVGLEVPDKFIQGNTGGIASGEFGDSIVATGDWVLSEDGLKYLVGRLADLVDEIEDAHIDKVKHGE